jgi:putative Mg2+ transporter-C (MgtC) family protein
MLSLEDMLVRLIAAAVFGAIVGLERELVGKEAGFRTDIMVAAGAAIFSIVSVSLPYILGLSPENVAEMLARNGGFLGALSNVVIGVGFLGAGIIVRQGVHVYGLTTAATIWFVAAIGVLCGIGLWEFAGIASIGLSVLLFVLRKLNVGRFPRKEPGVGEQ